MIASVIRKEARGNLKGKWKKSILMLIIFYITQALITFLISLLGKVFKQPLLLFILNIMITIALNYGLLVSFIRLKRNEKVNYLHFIYYAVKDLEKVWKVIGRLLLRLLIYIVGLVLSMYLLIIETVSLCYGYGVTIAFFVGIIGTIIFSILLTMNVLYYQLNNYILYDNNTWKAKQILNESKRLSTNHRWDIFKLIFSFAGWYTLAFIFDVAIILLMYFILGLNTNLIQYIEYIKYFIYITYLPMIFLSPYVDISKICFYDVLKANNPRKEDEEIKINKNKKSKKKQKNKKRK